MTQAHIGLVYSLEEAANECGMTVGSFKNVVYSKKLIEPVFTQETIDNFKTKRITRAKRSGTMAESTMRTKIRSLEKEMVRLEQRLVKLERRAHDHND